MNDTNFHLRKLEKEDQNKSKSEDKEKIKTKAEINGENRKQQRKVKKKKNLFLEETNKTENLRVHHTEQGEALFCASVVTHMHVCVQGGDVK